MALAAPSVQKSEYKIFQKIMDWTSIVLGVLTFISGFGWIIDRKKHRHEIESLRADNRQKDMNLSKDYVAEWRTYIAEPLTIVDLCRDSAKLMRAWLCARCSIGCSGRWGSFAQR